MAIAAMSHIRLIGLRSQENKIVDALTEKGLFEARRTEDIHAELSRGDGALFRELKEKQGRISFALGFLKARHAAMEAMLSKNGRDVKRGVADPIDYTQNKIKYDDSRTLITHADFSDARAKEYDLLGVCDALQKLSFDIVDVQSEINSVTSSSRSYEPFTSCPIAFSKLGRHGSVVFALYYTGAHASPEDALAALSCAYDVRRDNGVLVFAAVTADKEGELDRTLAASGFTRCTFDDDCTAVQKISELKNKKSELEDRLVELTRSALSYEKYVGELRILYDVIEFEIERAEADSGFLKSDGTFLLEGWLPEAVAESTVDHIRAECPNVFIQLLAPEDRDDPPTLVVNRKVVKPYEDITNLYSPPSYREADPNPVMAFFYFIFFGIMIGDAAYGLILAVLGIAFGLGKKFDRGAKRLLLLVGMGGISAIIWGVLFGGYFAIDFGSTKVAVWFNPLEDPMTMLILSLVLGAVQLVTAYVMLFIKLCREGKPFSAVFDAGSIILLFGALACLAVSFLFDSAPKGLTVAAIVLAVTGLVLIIVFGGRNSKNPVGKIFGGFKGVYGLVNLLSDLLSYCRLFGLGLASCAIGLAFNTLGTLIMGVGGIGYVLGVLLLIPLHAFNIAIGVMGAYVHDARLQFLEFYGKFYEGGGRLFEPLGLRTRYIRFE